MLATVATVIASQAVISGAFSVSRQAERLGYLPRLTVRHTSRAGARPDLRPGGQLVLFVGVLLLIVAFRCSARLATAYGLAVTGTLLLTTPCSSLSRSPRGAGAAVELALLGVPLAVLELTYFGANLTKVVHGGWLPLLIALVVATVMLTWQRGRTLVTDRRTEMEGPLEPFIDWLHGDPVASVPGTAVFLHPSKQSTPLALRENATFNHVIHENVLIVSTTAENVPHIPDDERVELDHLGDPYDAITHLTLRFGFQEEQDVPAALALARDRESSRSTPTPPTTSSPASASSAAPARDEPVAQAAVPRPGAQRRLADRVLPAPRGPDRRHGCHRRPLTQPAIRVSPVRISTSVPMSTVRSLGRAK